MDQEIPPSSDSPDGAIKLIDDEQTSLQQSITPQNKLIAGTQSDTGVDVTLENHGGTKGKVKVVFHQEESSPSRLDNTHEFNDMNISIAWRDRNNMS